MPVYVIKVVSGEADTVATRSPTYFVEAPTPEAALAAVQAERGMDGGVLEITEHLSRTDGFAVRSTGIWIQRVSGT